MKTLYVYGTDGAANLSRPKKGTICKGKDPLPGIIFQGRNGGVKLLTPLKHGNSWLLGI